MMRDELIAPYFGLIGFSRRNGDLDLSLTAGEMVVVKGPVLAIDFGSYLLGLLPFCVFPYLLVRSTWGRVEVWLLMWCTLELLFRVYVYLRVLEAEGRRPVPMKQMQGPVKLALSLRAQMGDPKVLSNWLMPGKILSKRTLQSLTTRIFYERAGHELSRAEVQQAKKLADIFKNDEEDVSFSKEILWPSSRPVQYKVRSIAVYAIMGGIRAAGTFKFYSMGFKWYHLQNGLGYWIYQTGNSNHAPVLYFHGIGFGPTQMLPHIKSLMEKDPKRTIILFNLPQISLSPFSPVASEEEILDAIDIIFKDNNLTKVSAVGHSYGTIICMWLAMRRPKYLARLTLIDPVCFMLWNSYLVTRAYYTKPTTVIHHLVKNFISQDHNFSITISRYMYWLCSFETCQAFPCQTNIYLGQRDWVIDAPATFNYLTTRKCKLNQTNINIHMNDIDHLQFMFIPSLQNQINQSI